MKHKKANPNECFQCGKPISADQEALRFEIDGCPSVTYCNRACFDARRADMQRRRDWEIAIHEAGHCLGSRLAKSAIRVATIEPGGLKTEGHIRSTTFGWEENITEYLLGHAAELEFGIDNDGHDYDYSQAVKDLKDMIKVGKHGVEAACKTSRWQFPSHALWREHQRKLRLPKEEWKPEFDKRVRKARRLAKKYRAWIERVANLLVEKRTLTDKEIPRL
jgi:hypothetical protein